MEQRPQRGLWCAHGAALLFGGTALFSELIQLSGWLITLHRAWIAIIGIILLLLIQRQSLQLTTRRDYTLHLGLGVLLGAHWATYFVAMQTSTIAIGLISLFTAPIITVFLSAMWERAWPQRSDMTLALLTLGGVCLLINHFAFSDASTQGVLWGIISALLLSIRNVTTSKTSNGNSGLHIMLYQTAGIFLSSLAILMVPSIRAENISTQDWQYLVILGIAFTATPHTMIATALIHLPAKTVILITSLMLVYGTILAWIILGQEVEPRTIMGGVIIAGCAIYESLRHR